MPQGQWVTGPGCQIRYLTGGTRGLAELCRLVVGGDFRGLYLNSFFDPTFAILPSLLQTLRRYRIPVLIAPRVELMPGNLRIKGMKKRCYLALQPAALGYDHLHWHATPNLKPTPYSR